MTLDLGPGLYVQPHRDQPAVRLDHRSNVNPTVVGDVRSLPFRSEVFSTVYSSHVLEHFPRRESSRLLVEWCRILAPGGELQLFVPNLEWAVTQIHHGIWDDDVRRCIYGRQAYESDRHCTGFLPDELASMVTSTAIWSWLDWHLFRNSICLRARKAQIGCESQSS